MTDAVKKSIRLKSLNAAGCTVGYLCHKTEEKTKNKEKIIKPAVIRLTAGGISDIILKCTIVEKYAVCPC